MSYSLSISGHHDNDSARAAEVDAIVRDAGRALVDQLRAIDAAPTYATFGGPTGSVNYLAEPVADSEGLRQLTGDGSTGTVTHPGDDVSTPSAEG